MRTGRFQVGWAGPVIRAVSSIPPARSSGGGGETRPVRLRSVFPRRRPMRQKRSPRWRTSAPPWRAARRSRSRMRPRGTARPDATLAGPLHPGSNKPGGPVGPDPRTRASPAIGAAPGGVAETADVRSPQDPDPGDLRCRLFRPSLARIATHARLRPCIRSPMPVRRLPPIQTALFTASCARTDRRAPRSCRLPSGSAAGPRTGRVADPRASAG